MSARIARAGELAEQLAGAGLVAVTDPRDIIGNLPCVLIGPPRLTFDMPAPHASAEWPLVALVGGPLNAAAWAELDRMLELVAGALPVERADPATYGVPNGGDPIPAYTITLREAV